MAIVPPGPLQNSRLKIERAKQHISELNSTIEAFDARDPYTIVVEKDSQSGNHLWTMRISEDIPQNLTVIIGDVIHNLRAALDLMISDIVIPLGAKPNKVKFPFVEHANALVGRIEETQINLAPKEVITLIKDLEPYPSGKSNLYGLHRLDIADKHTSLIATTEFTGIPYFSIEGTQGPIATFINTRFSPIKDGKVLFSIPPSENVKLGQKFIPSFGVTFATGQPFKGEPIVPTFVQLTELIKGVIESFKPYA
ncbi:MAG: hypothetical protein ACE1ZS_03040 [Candidatus Poribacteria bacterium]